MAAQGKNTAVTALYQWRNVEIVAGGFVDGFVFHPAVKDVFYTRTDIGGAYRWASASRRWIPLNDSTSADEGNLLGVESLAVDPGDPNRVYAAVGMYSNEWGGNGAILRSSNRGATWQKATLPFKLGANEPGRSIGERLAVDPHQSNIVYFGSRHNGLWKSVDRGATWAKVDSFPNPPDRPGEMGVVGVGWVVFDAASGKRGAATPTLYAGTGIPETPVMLSRDGGASWAAVAGQPTQLVPHHGILSPDGTTLFVSYGNGPGPNDVSSGAVWKGNTKTGIWTDITPQKGGFGYAGLGMDGKNPNVLVVATLDRWNLGDTIFRTTNGGKTWYDLKPKSVRDASRSPYLSWGRPEPVALGHWIGALAIDPFRPGHAVYGTGATIWATDDLTNADRDAPTHWTVGAEGLEETAVITLVSPSAGPSLLSGLGDIGGFRHDRLDVTPASGMYQNPNLSNTDGIDFAEAAPDMVVRVGRGGGSAHGGISRDSGATWKPFASEPSGVGNGGQSIALSSDGKTMVWTAGNAAFSSRDNGASWVACAGLPTGGQITAIVSDRQEATRFWAYDTVSGTLLASMDGGATFAPVAVAGGPTGAVHLRAAAAGNGLYLASEAKGIFHYTPRTGGGTEAGQWSLLPGIASAKSVGFGKAAPGQSVPALYVAGRTRTGGPFQILRSDNGGRTWIRINDDAHQYGWSGDALTGDPRVYGRVYLGTNGRGILVGEPSVKALTPRPPLPRDARSSLGRGGASNSYRLVK